MPKTKPQSLSVYLRRTGNGRILTWIRNQDDFEPITINVPGASGALLVAKTSRPHTPSWLELIEPGIDGDRSKLPSLTQSSASAVLLMVVANRQFAFPFGHGHHLLHDEQCEHDFGLRVVLNSVDVEQLKSVGMKSIDESTLRTKRDASRATTIGSFGLDPTSDLLREVAGVPATGSMFSRLAGSMSVSVSAKTDLSGLPEVAKSLLSAYRRTTYKKEFGWLDHFQPIRDQKQADRLDGCLVTDLKDGNLTYAHLAPPHQVDWEAIEGFTFSTVRGSTSLSPDPRISAYLESISLDDLSPEQLRKDSLQAYDFPSGSRRYNWSIHRCIVYERREGESRFVLSEGQWYEVDGAFAKRVTKYIQDLPQLDEELPKSTLNEKEEQYNERAANSINATCMDKKLVGADEIGRIEFCDIFTADGKMIHVKRRSGSSTLSHLFAQGVVPAELICDEDDAFRKATRKKLRAEGGKDAEAAISIARPDTSDLEVAYVVLTRGHKSNRNPHTLPFFSMVSLMNACRRLRALNYRVSITSVDEIMEEKPG